MLAVQESGESRMLGEAVDRLAQYFPPFDREEVMRHCEEARGGWEEARAGDPGPKGPA